MLCSYMDQHPFFRNRLLEGVAPPALRHRFYDEMMTLCAYWEAHPEDDLVREELLQTSCGGAIDAYGRAHPGFWAKLEKGCCKKGSVE